MSKIWRYTHEFVEFIPDGLAPCVLYVSTAYATAVHLCMCGCGFEVTSPLSPQQWCMIFDGRTVSVSPSIGNWSFECQSHYWLDRGTVDWAAKWSPQQIAVGRAAPRRRIEASRPLRGNTLRWSNPHPRTVTSPAGSSASGRRSGRDDEQPPWREPAGLRTFPAPTNKTRRPSSSGSAGTD